MADKENTGNPVFDFRAEFRRRADRAQSLAITAGLVLCGATVILWLITGLVIFAIGSGAGFAIFIGGIAWGYYWRRKVRAEFRRKYGWDD